VATAIAERLVIMVSGQVALETTSAAFTADLDAQRRFWGEPR
jgi:ABC-type branched-subunit amino acid transport system ATPase component